MDDSTAERLKALGDPLRLRLVRMLHDRGETCVCELLDELGTTQSNVSTHLRSLRAAGLVRGRKVGKWVFYALEGQVVDDLLAWLREALGSHTAGRGEPAATVLACCAGGDVPLSLAAARERMACCAPAEGTCGDG